MKALYKTFSHDFIMIHYFLRENIKFLFWNDLITCYLVIFSNWLSLKIDSKKKWIFKKLLDFLIFNITWALLFLNPRRKSIKRVNIAEGEAKSRYLTVLMLFSYLIHQCSKTILSNLYYLIVYTSLTVSNNLKNFRSENPAQK